MKLSIIVPVYNVEAYLSKCLDSVIDTSCSDYEIVCVNDGSRDGSGAILRKYKEKYPALIRVIEQENQGLSAARNTAIRNAAGEFVFLLDSDDYMDAGSVQKLLQMTETGADMMLIEYRAVDETGRQLSQSKTFETKGIVRFEEHPDIMFTMPTGVFRRSLYLDNDIFYPVGKLYEDLATMPKIFLHTDRIYYSGEVLYNYLLRTGSIMNSGNVERNVEVTEALNGINDYFRQHDAFDRYSKELEFINYYNQYITTIVRVSRIPGHGDQPAWFRTDFLKKFPDYRANPYVKKQPKKIQLLDWLISRQLYGMVAAIMNLNDRLKK